jgi:flagellar biosynthesis regulator FlbT
MKNMKNTTTGLIENLLQSLNVKAFIKGVQQFDNVTQRQCFLKALKEIRKSNIIELHGQERVRSTVKEINDALEVEVEVT